MSLLKLMPAINSPMFLLGICSTLKGNNLQKKQLRPIPVKSHLALSLQENLFRSSIPMRITKRTILFFPVQGSFR